MPTPFETFAADELGRRASFLTATFCAYDGDPNDPLAPAILDGAPVGTEYQQETPVRLWKKQTGGAWVEIPNLAGDLIPATDLQQQWGRVETEFVPALFYFPMSGTTFSLAGSGFSVEMNGGAETFTYVKPFGNYTREQLLKQIQDQIVLAGLDDLIVAGIDAGDGLGGGSRIFIRVLGAGATSIKTLTFTLIPQGGGTVGPPVPAIGATNTGVTPVLPIRWLASTLVPEIDGSADLGVPQRAEDTLLFDVYYIDSPWTDLDPNARFRIVLDEQVTVDLSQAVNPGLESAWATAFNAAFLTAGLDTVLSASGVDSSGVVTVDVIDNQVHTVEVVELDIADDAIFTNATIRWRSGTLYPTINGITDPLIGHNQIAVSPQRFGVIAAQRLDIGFGQMLGKSPDATVYDGQARVSLVDASNEQVWGGALVGGGAVDASSTVAVDVDNFGNDYSVGVVSASIRAQLGSVVTHSTSGQATNLSSVEASAGTAYVNANYGGAIIGHVSAFGATPAVSYAELSAGYFGTVMGHASTNGDAESYLVAGGEGSLVCGLAQVFGSNIVGIATAEIQAGGLGCVAAGGVRQFEGAVNAGFAGIVANGTGGVALGGIYSVGSTAEIVATDGFAWGHIDTLSVETAVASITADPGGVALGYVSDGSIYAGAKGTLALGYVNAPGGLIEALADNSQQFGPGTNDEADTFSVGTFFRVKGTDGAPVTPRVGDCWPDVAESALVVNAGLLPPDDSSQNPIYRLGDLDLGALPAVHLAVGGTFPIYIPFGSGDETVYITTHLGPHQVTLPENTTYANVTDLVLQFASIPGSDILASDVGGQLQLETTATGPGAFITLNFASAPTFAAQSGLIATTETGVEGANASWAAVEARAGKFVDKYQAAGGSAYVLETGPVGIIAGSLFASGVGSIAHIDSLTSNYFGGVGGPVLISTVNRATNGGTALTQASGGGAVALGTVVADFGDAQIQAGGAGSVAVGTAYVDTSGWYADITAGTASTVFGSANATNSGGCYVSASGSGTFVNATATANAAESGVGASGAGSFASGWADASAGGLAYIDVSADGGFAQGVAAAAGAASAANLTVTGIGGLAHGEATSGVGSTATITSGAGGFASGQAEADATFTALVEATSLGFAHGGAQALTANASVVASGTGAVALGYAVDTDIIASATNSVQFGPGTNAEPNSLQVGNAGIRFMGTTVAPGTPQDGDIRISGTDMLLRSSSVNVKVQTAAENVILAGGLTGLAVGTVTSYLDGDSSTIPSPTTVRRFPVIEAKTATALGVYVRTNALATATTATIFKNGASTGITLSITAATTGYFSATGTVSFASGDQFDVEITNTNGGVAMLALSATIRFEMVN